MAELNGRMTNKARVDGDVHWDLPACHQKYVAQQTPSFHVNYASQLIHFTQEWTDKFIPEAYDLFCVHCRSLDKRIRNCAVQWSPFLQQKFCLSFRVHYYQQEPILLAIVFSF